MRFLPFKGRINGEDGSRRCSSKPILTPALFLKEREVFILSLRWERTEVRGTGSFWLLTPGFCLS
jgi:hypothetical protein